MCPKSGANTTFTPLANNVREHGHVANSVLHHVRTIFAFGEQRSHHVRTMMDYDTCVLRLTRVRAQPQASKSVSRVCTCSFSDSSLQAPSCERVANSLRCLCTSGGDHVALDRSSWKLPGRSAGGIRSSARTSAFLLRPCSSGAQKHTTC